MVVPFHSTNTLLTLLTQKKMEGGIIHGGADESAFKECFSLTWKNPYVLRLAFSAGIGGLLFGYDTGKFSNLSTHAYMLYMYV